MARILIGLSLLLLLILPGNSLAQDTVDSTEGETYVIQPGDTLFSIARRYNTTVNALVEENGIADPSQIFWGQTIRIPGAQPAGPTAAPTQASPGETPVPVFEVTPEVAPITSLEYGLTANILGQNLVSLSNHIDSLGVSWVKQIVYWRDLEPVEGAIDFSTLDAMVTALADYQILLTVTAAPDWARSIQEESGPPDDYATYIRFVETLAQRYQGRVAAYQIWNEPNLRSRWKSTVHTISAESYMQLLRQSTDAIKSVDPSALVVSAGLAPTGYNDALNAEAGNLEINAVDDRVFLANMYASGLAGLVDGVGAHPIGWANPPDSLCCGQSEGVETHFEDPHFYFLETLQSYRQIQIQSGDAATPIWVTKFGWGTSEDLGQPDSANVFIAFTSLDEQAQYTQRAFEIGVNLGYVGPMFVYNLNECLAPDDDLSGCYYSLIGPDSSPRPVFEAISSIQKNTGEVETEEMPAAEETEMVEMPETEVTPEATPEAGP